MSNKRAIGLVDGTSDMPRSEKKTKPVNGSGTVTADAADKTGQTEEDAEWAAYQLLMAEHETSDTASRVERERSVDIEIDGGDDEDDDSTDGVTQAWDEEEASIETRLQNQEARKKYLEELRKSRDARIVAADTTKGEGSAAVAGDDDSDASSEGDDALENGWFN